MKPLSLVLVLCVLTTACHKKITGTTNAADTVAVPAWPSEIDFWLTRADQSALLQQQATVLRFGTAANAHTTLSIDTAQSYQAMEGFGYTLTSGSAELINRLNATDRAALLRELFTTEGAGIGVSYLRLSIGASDLSASVYSYNDLPAGQTDPEQLQFSLAEDRKHVIPLLKEIVAIHPSIKLMGSPWSPPLWMKDNGSSIGGSLRPEYYPAYAKYLVQYIQGMQAEGITIDAITPQNEPLHPGNNPSLYMTWQQQADFIKNHLGPAFRTAGINTKIIVYDHNADHPEYAINILNDPAARPFVHGSAFHLYAGDITALSTVHDAHPDKHLYFTEQYTASTGSFSGDLRWHLKNLIVGAPRNWSRTVLEWNLANDPAFGPHTQGGCTTCKGALTISNTITRNVSYYIIAHASKFVPPGSVRIASEQGNNLFNVAYKRPDGKKVLIIVNDNNTPQTFNIRTGNRWFTATLEGGAVGTFVWN